MLHSAQLAPLQCLPSSTSTIDLYTYVKGAVRGGVDDVGRSGLRPWAASRNPL